MLKVKLKNKNKSDETLEKINKKLWGQIKIVCKGGVKVYICG